MAENLKKQEIPKLTTKQNIGCLLIAIPILIAVYYFASKWGDNIAHRKAEENENALFQQSMQRFVADSNMITDNVIQSALDIIEWKPSSKESDICRRWIVAHGFNENDQRIRLKKETDSFTNAAREKVSRDLEENGYQPEGDEKHVNAFYAAQEFVQNRLKSPTSAKFRDKYHWWKRTDGSYKIILVVDSENTYGAMLRSHWSLKLHEDGDAWKLDDIHQINFDE